MVLNVPTGKTGSLSPTGAEAAAAVAVVSLAEDEMVVDEEDVLAAAGGGGVFGVGGLDGEAEVVVVVVVVDELVVVVVMEELELGASGGATSDLGGWATLDETLLLEPEESVPVVVLVLEPEVDH